jgi:hypothetical protein
MKPATAFSDSDILHLMSYSDDNFTRPSKKQRLELMTKLGQKVDHASILGFYKSAARDGWPTGGGCAVVDIKYQNSLRGKSGRFVKKAKLSGKACLDAYTVMETGLSAITLTRLTAHVKRTLHTFEAEAAAADGQQPLTSVFLDILDAGQLVKGSLPHKSHEFLKRHGVYSAVEKVSIQYATSVKGDAYPELLKKRQDSHWKGFRRVFSHMYPAGVTHGMSVHIDTAPLFAVVLCVASTEKDNRNKGCLYVQPALQSPVEDQLDIPLSPGQVAIINRGCWHGVHGYSRHDDRITLNFFI